MRPPSALEQDRLLVSRLLAGEEKSFEEFFSAYFPRLYRFALPRLGNDEGWTEDVVQATLARALRRLESWRGEASLYTWLCQVCRNEVVDHFRRENRHLESQHSFDDQEAADLALDSLEADEQSRPEVALASRDLQQAIRNILDGLAPGYGDALLWKYVEGLSVQEIGQRLEIGTTAAQSVLARARRAFKVACEETLGATADALLERMGI